MMVIGVSEERFWNSTVRQLKPYADAYEKKQYEVDRHAHLFGAYVHDAVSVALGNAFAKKGSKKLKYPQEPYTKSIQEEKRIEQLSEEEKKDQVEKIFEMLSGGQK